MELFGKIALAQMTKTNKQTNKQTKKKQKTQNVI
jgi:hypothetical protein